MRLAPRRIALADTDALGHAHAGRLAELALRCLEEALAAVGLDPARAPGAAEAAVLARLACDYRRPLPPGAQVTARVELAALGARSATLVVHFGRALRAEAVLVWIAREDGRPRPWPAAVRRRLARLASGTPAARR